LQKLLTFMVCADGLLAANSWYFLRAMLDEGFALLAWRLRQANSEICNDDQLSPEWEW
jgi:hypothetical protein